MNRKRIAITIAAVILIGWFATPAEARIVTVFGDSLSDWRYSYAEQLRSPNLEIRKITWPGLKQGDFQVPAYFSCNKKQGKEVILQLGTNDAVFGRPLRYRRSLIDSLNMLKARNCTVYLAMAVQWTDVEPRAQHLRDIRIIQRHTAKQYSNVILVDMHYDRNQLIDQLHPNEYQHSLIASQFREILGE